MPWSLPRLYPALFCAAAVAVCALLTHPVIEMGLNDDWSYIYSSRHLAETGHVAYNGWATAMVGWQMALGSLFIQVFGFSFTVTRVPVLIVSLITVFLLQRSLVRMGISEWNATLGTLTVALSPLFLPLTFSFMTDIPGLLSLLLCLYLCLRALDARRDRSALMWLAGAAISNMLLGTVRQTGWLGVLVLVPSTAWLLRRRRGALPLGAVMWVAGVAVIAGCLRWLAHQPYSVPEKLVDAPIGAAVVPGLRMMLVYTLLAMSFYLLPVLVGFAVRFPFRNRRALAVLAGCGVGLLLVVAVEHTSRHDWNPFLAPFLPGYYAGNLLSPRGVFDIGEIEGLRPVVLGAGVRAAMTVAVGAALCCFGALLLRPGVDRRRGVEVERFPYRTMLQLLGPLALSYYLLLLPRSVLRGHPYDRYFLPLLVLALAPLLALYQDRCGDRLPGVSVVLVALMAGFGVAGMHDVFAADRARLVAIDEIRAAGYPRTAIRGGWEYDGWTQVDATGYVNEPRMVNPPGAYHAPTAADAGLTRCQSMPYTPSIRPLYAVSYDPAACLGLSGFRPVPFRAWLAPHDRSIYVVRVR